MPGSAVHLLIADRVMGPDLPPGAAAREALRLGSVAPDMGYFPGGDQFASDLAHYHTPATLTRNLWRLAQDEVGRQFARGWATHVLADVLIHPLINRAAGELTGGPTPRTYAEDPVAHVRVEQGLDAAVAGRGVRPPRVPVSAHWGLTALLGEAYRRTYGVGPPGLRLEASILATARFCPWVLGYARAAGWRLRLAPGATHPGVLAAAGFDLARMVSALARRTVLYGLGHPIAPSPWLLAESDRVIATFPERFAAFAATGFVALPEANLDTGEVEPASHPYPLTARTAAELDRRTGATSGP